MNQTKLKPNEKKYLRILAKKHILLPTKHKKPLVKNWNKFYEEKRTIEQLLTINQEYSLRTGKLVGGGYYFVAIDLDDYWAKERINIALYIETNKGIHRYILIKELLKSCWLVNKEGNKKLGELHAWGRFVVGIGSIHQQGTRYTLKGRVNEKWSLKFEKLTELQAFLNQRNIFTTPWGKTGIENISELTPFKAKNKPKKLSERQIYCQKREQLEEKVSRSSNQNLNICYLCLVYFAKQDPIIKAHLNGKKHQNQVKIWQAKQKNKPISVKKTI